MQYKPFNEALHVLNSELGLSLDLDSLGIADMIYDVCVGIHKKTIGTSLTTSDTRMIR